MSPDPISLCMASLVYKSNFCKESCFVMFRDEVLLSKKVQIACERLPALHLGSGYICRDLS